MNMLISTWIFYLPAQMELVHLFHLLQKVPTTTTNKYLFFYYEIKLWVLYFSMCWTQPTNQNRFESMTSPPSWLEPMIASCTCQVILVKPWLEYMIAPFTCQVILVKSWLEYMIAPCTCQVTSMAQYNLLIRAYSNTMYLPDNIV